MRLSPSDIARFADWSGDHNPLHVDARLASRTFFGRPVVHGVLALVEALREAQLDGPVARLQVEFQDALFPDQSYEVEVGRRALPTTVSVHGPKGTALVAKLSSDPATVSGRAPSSDGGGHRIPPIQRKSQPRTEPADRRLGEIEDGVDLDGVYSLGSEPFGPNGDVPLRPAQLQVLGLCSHLVGMELPGLRSLFTRLRLDFNPDQEDAGDLQYRLNTLRYDKQFRILDTELDVTTVDGTWVASGEIRSYVRFSPVVTDLAVLESGLGEQTASLRGKVALVVGGSRGLGADIASAFALAGAHVYVGYRSSVDEARQLAERVHARRGNIELVQGDVGDSDWCAAVRQKIVDRHGRLDVLLLNACAPPRPMKLGVETTTAFASYVTENLRLVETPLVGFLSDLESSRGSVVAISSSFVEEPPAEFAHYVALKQATEGLIRSARTERPAVSYLVARPPRLLTSWNDTPTGVLGALPTSNVALRIVNEVAALDARDEVTLLSDFTADADLPSEPESADAGGFQFAVAASFTADPIAPTLKFWAEELGLDASATIAPYGQVMQQLLDPSSLLSSNGDGHNIVLVRIADWLRELPTDSRESANLRRQHVEVTARDFVRAVKTHRGHASTETLVALCPSGEEPGETYVIDTESWLREELSAVPGLRVVVATEHHASYAVSPAGVHDPLRDGIGHIPYQDQYFTFLGSLLVRSIYSRLLPPRKVVAVDCDNTLWSGVVGEVGADGVSFAAQHRSLHMALAKLSTQGFLVCLCSKNDEEDVWRVFDTRSDFGLGREQVVASAINWDHKSENLRLLASRLNLGLDSFIFIDDNPVECAAVRAACPEVLTLQWPEDGDQASRLLRHLWEFDTASGTREDRQRTGLYRDEFRRQELKEQTLTFQDFIESLGLVVDTRPLTDDDLPRAAQLTLRTNQFNFTTRRRTEGELQAIAVDDRYVCRTVRVHDRFGDYGMVGLLIAEAADTRLEVDTFLLSCRVLGRGVEHEMAAILGSIAQDRGLPSVSLHTQPTKRNEPARAFLASISGAPQEGHQDGRVAFDLPSETLSGLRFEPAEAAVATAAALSTPQTASHNAPVGGQQVRIREEQIARTAYELSTVGELHAAIDQPGAAGHGAVDGGKPSDVGPVVYGAFAESLSIPEQTLRQIDQLDALGCSSFKIVEITVALTERFPWLPSTLLFEHRSVSEIVTAIESLSDTTTSRPAETRGPATVGPTEHHARSSDIAVVGMNVRCGGADSVDALWELLSSGRTAVKAVPRDRAPVSEGRTHYAALVADVDLFDAEFFGISPREAEFLDPQLRLLLEVTYRGLEDAGLVGSRHQDDTGVFVGAMYSDYQVRANLEAVKRGSPYRCWEPFSLANRVSQVLGLTGPSLTVSTACSSSGTALHLACRSLMSRECGAAVVAGVNLILDPDRFAQLGRLGILSAEGRCEAFGADADGTVLGEGVGVVVLRRLDDALERGDHIYGLVKGTGVSSGTGTVGFTAPNPNAQAVAIRNAVKAAQIDPRTISYVETHGTGTSLGDPIEVRGLTLAYTDQGLWDQELRGDHRCRLGSIKPNVGHLEAGAGILGLIKVLLQMEHRALVPSLTSNSPNPRIPFEDLPFEVQTELMPWERPTLTRWGVKTDMPRRAGLSSFGVGGANAHAIIEEAPSRSERRDNPVLRPARLLRLSARGSESLRAQAVRLIQYLSTRPDLNLNDLAYTLSVGRPELEERAVIVASDREQLVELLQNLSRGGPATGISRGTVAFSASAPKTAFLFTGQGSQYPGMAKGLYRTEPAFTRAIDTCAEILTPLLDRSLVELLFTDDDDQPISLLHQTKYTQPALFSIEYAIAQMWRSWGIEPDVVLGHSVGEIAALCVAGGVSLEDGLELIAARGRLMQALPTGGAMTSIRADESRVRDALAGLDEQVSIAAINGPENVVISGAASAVALVAGRFETAGVKTTALTVSHAFHSPLMDPMLSQFESLAGAITFSEPRIPFVSCVEAKRLGRDQLTAQYWVRQVRHAVRFIEAIQVADALGTTTYLEVGPQPVLAGLGRACLTGSDRFWLPSLKKGRDAWPTVLGSLAKLHTLGASIDWEAFEAPHEGRLTRLPAYPFQRKSFWIDSALPTPAKGDDQSATVQDQLYEVEWSASPRPSESVVDSAEGHWVVMADRGGVGRALSEELSERGARCTLVYAGARFESEPDGSYEIDPRLPQHFDRLRDDLGPSETLRGVAYLWGLDQSTSVNVSDLQADVGSLLAGAANVLRTLVAKGASWRIVTQGAMVPPKPEIGSPVAMAQSALCGFGRTALLEYTAMSGGLIDLASDDSASISARVLVEELLSTSSDNQIRYRDGTRLVPRLVRRAHSASKEPLILSGGGAYLVTGGLGAVGLALAEWLVAKGARHLFLAGRRPTGDTASDERLAALRGAGVTVNAVQADVSIAADVDRLIETITAVAPLRGVVHAAGIDHREMISAGDSPEVEAVLAPKVMGAWLLHERTRNLDLELFILCSSISSVWGASGRSAYAGANSFQDALAWERHRLGLPALAVNWGPWSGGGMASEADLAQLERIGIRGLRRDHALAALDTVVPGGGVQVTVAEIDWSRFRSVHESQMQTSFFAELGDARPSADAASSETVVSSAQSVQEEWVKRLRGLGAREQTAKVCQPLRAEVARVLGFASPEEVRMDQGLYDIGLDSLIAVDLADSLQTQLGIHVSVGDLGQPNLEALSAVLLDRLGAADKSADESNEEPLNDGVQESRPVGQDVVSTYTKGLEPKVVAFQELAYPHRRKDWIADRWRWMFVESAKRLGVEPEVWLCQDGGAVVAHHGALPVRLRMGDQERTVPWFVESMVLERYRSHALGTQLLERARKDYPFSLSLGQAPFMRDIQLKMGWTTVGPLETYMYLLNPKAVLGSKLKGRLASRAAAQVLGAATQVKRVSGRPRSAWQPEVRQVSQFGSAHDELWQSVSDDFLCAVVRDASYLNWKYVAQPGQQFDRLEILRNGSPVAVAIVSYSEPNSVYRYRRAFLVDLVLRPSDTDVVWTTLDAVRRHCVGRSADALVLHLTSALLGGQVQRFGFLRRESTRTLLIDTGRLPEPLTSTLSSIDNWYLTMGDSDIDRPWADGAANEQEKIGIGATA